MLLKYYKGSLVFFLVYFQLKCPRETQMTSESFVPLGWVSFCIKEPDEIKKMLRRKEGGNYHSAAAAISLGFMSSLYRLTKIRRNNSKKTKQNKNDNNTD